MILTENDVLKLMQRIKSFYCITIKHKSSICHTHTLSEIDDLSNIQMGMGYKII